MESYKAPQRGPHTARASQAFPAWRLPKGMINASDEGLEKSIESCERWEWFGGGLVFAGVAATVAIAIVHPKYDSFLEQWGSAIADSLVAAGVAIEIKFGQMAGLRQNELKRRSDEKVAEANTIAAEANERAANLENEAALLRLRLEHEIKKHSLRFLDDKQKAAMLDELRGTLQEILLVVQNDPEAHAFSVQLAALFEDAGAKVRSFQPPRADKWWAPAGLIMYSPTGETEADPLCRALKRANLFGGTMGGPFTSGQLPGNAPPILIHGYCGHVLYVGQRPPF